MVSTLAIWFSVILLASTLGCDRDSPTRKSNRTIVTPVAKSFPYELTGKLHRVWGGDQLEVFDSDKKIHWVELAGARGPEPNQKEFRQTQRKIWKAFSGKPIRVTVYGLDEFKCEIGKATIESTDLSMYLIENGLGWEDRTDYPDKENYQAAEEKAREEKLGIWSYSPPLKHPLDFAAEHEEQLLDRIKKGTGR